jgi:hypothetical protein
MVSGGLLSVYLCGLESRGHPRDEEADTSWICRSEVFGYHPKPEQHDMRLGNRARFYSACPWKRRS